MAEHSHRESKPKPSLMASPFYWLAVGPTLIFALLAFVCSWPLGPNFVDEGGVTKLRLAIALVALALWWGILFILILLGRLMRTLEDVSAQLSQFTSDTNKSIR